MTKSEDPGMDRKTRKRRVFKIVVEFVRYDGEIQKRIR